MTDCIFCKIAKKEMPSSTVYEDERLIAFLDISPVHKGHVLAVPKSHTETSLDTADEDLSHLIITSKKIARAVMNATGAQGINFGINNYPASGQVVLHTHMHIIPRYDNDGLKHWPQGTYANKEEMNEWSQKIANQMN